MKIIYFFTSLIFLFTFTSCETSDEEISSIRSKVDDLESKLTKLDRAISDISQSIDNFEVDRIEPIKSELSQIIEESDKKVLEDAQTEILAIREQVVTISSSLDKNGRTISENSKNLYNMHAWLKNFVSDQNAKEAARNAEIDAARKFKEKQNSKAKIEGVAGLQMQAGNSRPLGVHNVYLLRADPTVMLRQIIASHPNKFTNYYSRLLHKAISEQSIVVTKTDNSGNFVFDDLERGKYFMYIRSSDQNLIINLVGIIDISKSGVTKVVLSNEHIFYPAIYN
jgi:hypothetical protein